MNISMMFDDTLSQRQYMLPNGRLSSASRQGRIWLGSVYVIYVDGKLRKRIIW